ncbi:fe(2+) transport protein 1 [Ricinus communis]|uniref:Zinc/iron transporter, putative n=1 Tax=Ricinus communis TaxID=3988 RepID=B9RLD5_RICCO|nr:fe(2+) transport protein 1 [Ricinus communis]EEF47660.1 zinc/iron transporter, putative [Ricinus communis]|eukprot:XP_002514554.1 fe(2+) transport protein 1 [Ricinus communis]
MATRVKLRSKMVVSLLIILSFALTAFAEECESKSDGGGRGCHDKAKSLKLKLIAIASILITSMIGVCLPLFSRAVPALMPDRDLFAIVKAFASGVILATGYMHVLPDSFDCLRSECLPENPWRKFPFTTFVAMLSALFTLMVDSFAMSYYKKWGIDNGATGGGHHHHIKGAEELGNLAVEDNTDGKANSEVLLRHRVVAQVLELGIVVHSVVIGLSMGASDNPCTIRPLIAALCFHQLFEGMGLGGCILQAEYGMKIKAMMVFFFSATTPLGIALGIGLSNVYSDNSPTALIVVGLLNASSAGLLNYMALVDLLAADFMGPKLQQNLKLQILAYVSVLLGAGGMSLMAKWA